MDNGLQERLLAPQEHGDQQPVSHDLRGRIKKESKEIWRVAFPGIISRVSTFGIVIVTQSFLGHVSSLDLAAYALVQTLNLRFVNGILLGMSSATETLCAQSFGAGQHSMMGVYLQRSWIVNFSTATLALPIFIFSGQLFELLGEEKGISMRAGYLSKWIIPLAYSYVFTMTMQMYLQAQLKNKIVAYLAVVQFLIHILLSWVLVYELKLGALGAVVALSLSAWFTVLGEFAYIFGGWCPNTWKGFTMAAFKDLFPVIKLSISSGAMLCLELWYYSVLVLIAGYMENAEVSIAAFSICLSINGWEIMISIGFLGAAIVRVAHNLGSGNAEGARFSIRVLLATSVTVGLFFFILCLSFGSKIGYLFTTDEKVSETVSDLSTLLSFSMLLNSIYPILSGVAIGAGLQTTVAVITLCCYYVLGIPLGALLGYVFHMGAKGLWIGMFCGVVAQTLSLLILISTTNWDTEVTKASARLKRWNVISVDASDESSRHAVLE